jgi:hypothetical protein
MRKRAGRKGYKEKDREDGGRMVKRRWRGRRDTRDKLCLPALSKLEFFSLAPRKIALSLKCFPILSSYLLIRSHSMFMLALVITIIIVDTLFRPHLTIMSSTIYMYISVHKKNPIKIGRKEGI